jgi:hypothetical protein
MLKQGFFDSAGVRLQYLDWGGTGQSVVLLAGLGAQPSGTEAWHPDYLASFALLG